MMNTAYIRFVVVKKAICLTKNFKKEQTHNALDRSSQNMSYKSTLYRHQRPQCNGVEI